jgi:hypothetical protein
MLLDLIEHQEELFAAIIGTLNYHSLCALRITCKALFAAISGAHRWQHMRNFAPSLRQINSIQRAILCDDEEIQTTIIYRNNYYVIYRMGLLSRLEVRRCDESRKYYYMLYDMVVISGNLGTHIYNIENRPKNIPCWLS